VPEKRRAKNGRKKVYAKERGKNFPTKIAPKKYKRTAREKNSEKQKAQHQEPPGSVVSFSGGRKKK